MKMELGRLNHSLLFLGARLGSFGEITLDRGCPSGLYIGSLWLGIGRQKSPVPPFREVAVKGLRVLCEKTDAPDDEIA